MSLWTRLFARPTAPSPTLKVLLQRVDELEARVDYVDGGLRKLRGYVTGAKRKADQDSEEPPTEAVEAPVPRAPTFWPHGRRRNLRGF